MLAPKKSLGQHWLNDQATLAEICRAADLSDKDTVLEIGPGQGSLTAKLTDRAGQVIAVELDAGLARQLPSRPNLQLVQANILEFDLTQLPPGYKVVANIPYYLTSNLIRVLCESANPPQLMVLLVQKEVAQRLAAAPGQMSLLSVSAQLYYSSKLGPVVKAELFEPPPKVDSQVIILTRRPQPLVESTEAKGLFRLVKAGFAGRRKKLRGSLAAGLGISKDQADQLLTAAGLSPDQRAQELSLANWHDLYLASVKLVL